MLRHETDYFWTPPFHDGHALDDCPWIYGDSVDRAVEWVRVGDEDVSAGVADVAGRAVRLVFEFKDADLYSF